MSNRQIINRSGRIYVKSIKSGIPTNLFTTLLSLKDVSGTPTSVNSFLQWDSDLQKFTFSASTISDSVLSNLVDSAVSATVDSDYINSILGTSVNAATLNNQPGSYYLDYNNLTNVPSAGTDSSTVSSIIIEDVDKAFIDALNVEADTLDGQHGAYYLDYNNFTNTPSIPSAYGDADVISLVDSAYVQARQSATSSTGVDSAAVTSLIDSDYINARVDAVSGTDSATVRTIADEQIALADTHDSAAVQGQIDATVNALDTHDSAAVVGQINLEVDQAFIDQFDTHDSSAVQGQIDTTLAGDVTVGGNLTVDGYIAGPATMTIDPATVGTDSGTLIVLGNLQVEGETTTVNSTTVSISDKNIVLADSATNASQADDAGITVNGANATIQYKATGDKWEFNKPLFHGADRVLTTADDLHDSAAVQGQIDATVNALDTHDSAAVVGQINDVVDQTYVRNFIDQSFIDTFDTHDSAAIAAQISSALISAGSLDSAAVATIADERIALTDTHDSAAVDGQIDAAFAAKSTTDVAEGTNLYYTDARFDSRFNTKSTSNLSEGSNLYYTTSRANSAIDARVTQSYVNNLNVDADTLDGQHGTHYLDYSNFTNTPNILDSNHVDALIDSSISAASIGDLADVDLTNIQQGYVIKWDSAQSKFIAAVDATTGGAGLEADTLDGQHGTYYLNYNNFTNTPNVLDSNNVSAIIIEDVDQAFIDQFDTHDSAAINGQIDDAFAAKSTTNLAEGTNLYYTSSRANSDFDTRLATKSTSNLSEGSNLYYTTTRANSAIDARVTQSYVEGKITQGFIDTFDTHDSAAVQGQIDATISATDTHDSAAVQGQIDATFVANSTDDLSEGSNLYYTTARVDSAFDVRLATKTTTDVAEGDNLYYTQVRVDSAIDARVGQNFVDQFDTHDSALVSGQINNEVTFNFVDALVGVFDSSHIPNLELGTDTHGNYVSTVTGTSNQINVSDNIGDIVISLPSNVTIDSNLTVNGYIAGPANMVIDPATVGTDSGTLTILGNLVVEGETTTVNSTTVTISDKNIVLADSATNATQANDAGITVNGANATLQYKATGDQWQFNKAPYYLAERLLTTADDLHDSAAVQGQIDSNFAAKSTSNLSEGSNLYYTTARVDSAFDVRLATKTTTDVAEGDNLYYTTARADSDAKNAVSAAGDLSYNPATGVFSIDVEEIYTKANFDSDLAAGFATDAVTTTDLTEGSNLYYTKVRVDSDIDLRITSKTTTDVAEGDNLYYTTARADSDAKNAVSAAGDLSYNPATGVFSIDVEDIYTKANFDSDLVDALATDAVTTTNLTEGNNLYYTTARADSDARYAVSAAGDLSYDPVTGVFSFDVEDVYTKSNFDSDFNAALDEAVLQGVGLAYDDVTNTLRIDSAELAAFALPIRSYFSAGGDLSYNSTTGQFSIDVADLYSKADFDSDFNIAIDEASLDGIGLAYDQSTNTLRIDSAELSAFALPIRSYVSASGDLSYDASTGVFSIDVEQIYTKANFDSDLGLALDTNAVTTTDLTEGSNLYYTTARVDSAIDVRVDSDFIRPFIDQAFIDTFDTHDSAAVLGQINDTVNQAFIDGFDTHDSAAVVGQINATVNQAFIDQFDTHDSAAVVGQINLEVDKAFVDALGVDADTVDGLQATQFLRSDADDTTTGNLTVEGNLTTSNLITFEGDSATVANLTTAIVATAAISSVQAIEATVVSVNATSGERQVSRVLLTHDTTDTYMNEYAVINTGASDEFTLDADTSGGNFRLKLDNISGNTLFAKSSITYL